MEITTSLKKNYEFRRLYTKGRSSGTSCLVVYCRRNGRERNRLGITVSAKVGCAVERNRVRRRIREIYRLNEKLLKQGFDIVIVAKYRSVRTNYHELERSFLWSAKSLGISLQDESGGRAR